MCSRAHSMHSNFARMGFPASECLMAEILIDRVIQEIDDPAETLTGDQTHFHLKSHS